MGRGGRVVLDRVTSELDDYWSNLDYTIYDNIKSVSKIKTSSELINDTNSVVVALKSDKTDDNIAPPLITKHNNHLISEQMLILNNTNSHTRTNNNHCSNNVINNDKLLSVDRNNVRSSVGSVQQQSSQHLQDTLEFGIKKEIIDTDYDKILANYHSISNITDYSSIISTSSSSHNSNTIIKTENIDISQNSGLSSVVSVPTGSSSLVDQGTGTFGSLSNINNMSSSWNQENLNVINSSDSTNKIPSILSKSSMEQESQTSIDDLLLDVHNKWLHFRPSTPDEISPPSPLFDDIPQYSETTPLCVEVQNIGTPPPPSIYADVTDNVFLSNPFSLSDLQSDPSSRGLIESTSLDASSTSSNGSELHSTSDSLNELNLSLGGTNEDNEKMLDTILQDCQIEDLKSFHTTSNFWNGILEDTGFLNSLDIVEDKNFDKCGYDSELLNELRDPKTSGTIGGGGNNHKKKSTSRIGHSSFSVSNVVHDNFFKKESPKKDNDDGTLDTEDNKNVAIDIENKVGVSSSAQSIVDDVKIKLEPVDNFIPSTNLHATSSATNSIYFQNTNNQTSVPVVKPIGGGQTENMILLSSSSLRKHMNGPSSSHKTGES